MQARRFLSPEEYEAVSRRTTVEELEKLQNFMRDHDDLVKHTSHLKRQIWFFSSLRIHAPTLKSSFWEPLIWISRKKWVSKGFLWSISATMILQFLLTISVIFKDFFNLRNALYLWELIMPCAMYITFRLIYALQKSSWRSSPQKLSQNKLNRMQLLSPDPKNPKTIDAAEYAESIIELSKTKSTFKYGIHFFAVLIAVVNTSLRWIYCYFAPGDCPSCFVLSYAPVNFAVCCIASISSYLCTFLFYWLFFLELGLSLREFYRKFAILSTFTEANTQKRNKNTEKEEEEFREILESSFDADDLPSNSILKTKKKAQDIEELPVLKLNNPQNIIVWGNIRSYLQKYNQAKLHEFEIALGSILIASFFLALGLFLRAFLQNQFTVFDLIATFNIAILGIYLLLVIYIGARTDAILKSHVKILYMQQWKLRQKVQMQVNNNENFGRKVTPMKRQSDEFLRRENSPGIERQLRESIDTLGNLIQIMQIADTNVTILFVNLNYGLLWKVLTYIVFGLSSGINSAIRNWQNKKQ